MNIIDVHVHGIGGYDTRTTDIEHILRIAEIEASKGVSEIILTVYPSTIKVMRQNMEAIKKAMERQLFTKGKETFSSLSKISGIHLEGPFLNPARCGSLNAMTFIEPSERNLMVLIEGFEDVIKIITIAPELDGSIRLIRMINDMGIVASMGHSDATFSEAEAGFRAGARGITHIFNAMRGIHHREPGLAGFGIINQDIYIEVISDPFHLHSEFLKFILNAKRKDRIILVSDSVKETKVYGEDKGIFNERGKLLGGSETITESAERLINLGIDKDTVFRFITENPIGYLFR